MPFVLINNKKIKYKTHVLYPGVKQINKEIAEKNLIDLKHVLDKFDIKFLLIAGTLLGAVRDHDFISHDEDVDLAFLEEDKTKLFECLPVILDCGFEIARYDSRGLLSLIREGEYIDLYFFRKMNDEPNIRTCSGWLLLENFLTNTTKFRFKGEIYNIPLEYTEFLKYEYGDTWMEPVRYFSYDLPLIKKVMYFVKEMIKEVLPDFILTVVLKKAEKKLEAKYRIKINNYLQSKSSL